MSILLINPFDFTKIKDIFDNRQILKTFPHSGIRFDKRIRQKNSPNKTLSMSIFQKRELIFYVIEGEPVFTLQVINVKMDYVNRLKNLFNIYQPDKPD